MNYIELINRFWIANIEHSFTGNETKLYFYLLNISNSLGWKNPFRQSDRQIHIGAGISVNSIKSGRNRLAQSGLISFKRGKQGNQNTIANKTTYELFGGSKIDTPTVCPTVCPTVPPTVPPTVGVNKPKKTKKKKEVKEELNLPFSDLKFVSAWEKLRAMPKWKKKLVVSLQAVLNKLGKYHVDFAIQLMERAIEGNYQGVVYANTDSDYQKWLASNKTKQNNKKPNELW